MASMPSTSRRTARSRWPRASARTRASSSSRADSKSAGNLQALLGLRQAQSGLLFPVLHLALRSGQGLGRFGARILLDGARIDVGMSQHEPGPFVRAALHFPAACARLLQKLVARHLRRQQKVGDLLLLLVKHGGSVEFAGQRPVERDGALALEGKLVFERDSKRPGLCGALVACVCAVLGACHLGLGLGPAALRLFGTPFGSGGALSGGRHALCGLGSAPSLAAGTLVGLAMRAS